MPGGVAGEAGVTRPPYADRRSSRGPSPACENRRLEDQDPVLRSTPGGRRPSTASPPAPCRRPSPSSASSRGRVQQEGALDLTQGDYKNADFAPHPEVVRAAQRITRNTVHSYGPAVGRMDVRSEVAEFFNRDGLLDYPDSEVRFLPDEVIFTPGTRAGLAFVLEVLGADGSGVVVPRPSWEYDWFVERAGKTVVELPDVGARVPPRPGGARPAPRAREGSPPSSSTTRTTRPGASTRAPSSRTWCGWR